MPEQSPGIAARIRANNRQAPNRRPAAPRPTHPFNKGPRQAVQDDESHPVDKYKTQELQGTVETGKYVFEDLMRRSSVPGYTGVPDVPMFAPEGILGRGQSISPTSGGTIRPGKIMTPEDILSDIQIDLEYDPEVEGARQDIESEARGAVRVSALELAGAMAEEFHLGEGPSPPGEPPAVDSGELLRSIGFAIDSDGLGSVVGASAPHAIYLEFGTLNMPARPFLLPAVERMRHKIVRNIEAAGVRAQRRRGLT